MKREPTNCSLQSTILVHDAYLALSRQRNLQDSERPALLAAAAQIMRRLLIDRARARLGQKRGGKKVRETLRPVASSGPIELQSFTGKVSFRNIYLRALEPTGYAGGDASPKKATLEESAVARRSFSPPRTGSKYAGQMDALRQSFEAQPTSPWLLAGHEEWPRMGRRCAIRATPGSPALLRRLSAHEQSSAGSANYPSKRIRTRPVGGATISKGDGMSEYDDARASLANFATGESNRFKAIRLATTGPAIKLERLRLHTGNPAL
jgi:hypothetical protein